MIRRQLPVINKLGLHARAATKLASAAAHHQCAVRTGSKNLWWTQKVLCL